MYSGFIAALVVSILLTLIALALGRLVGSGVAEREGSEFVIAPSSLTSHISGEGLDMESSLPLTRESAVT